MIWKIPVVLLSLTPIVAILVTPLLQMSAEAQTVHHSTELLKTIPKSNRNYIGLRYKNVPKGLTDLGGWVVGNDLVNGREYVVANVKKGAQQMLWLEVILARDTEGRPTYQVIDVLNLPTITNSVQLTHGGQCERNGVTDPELITIARYQDTAELRQILRAWRANRRSGKFEVASVRNIVCSNRGQGI
jgi:hypothetical protein